MESLDIHVESLLEQYRDLLPRLAELEQHATSLLSSTLSRMGISLNTLEHRIKTEASLSGKLERKGQKYKDISDVTDLVGIRVVTFFTDDVDRVAAIVKELFRVDWKNSVDKRKRHDLTSFGYSSLHYICRMHEGELSNIAFEVQIRTVLQHAWSAIEHDIGYKGSVKLPPEFQRQFSRLAGMLELADDEFSRLRTTMSRYSRDLQNLVASGRLEKVPLNHSTFSDFLKTRPFDRLNHRIAAVNQAEIVSVSLLPFYDVLEKFGFKTLGDVEAFVRENEEDAYQLALTGLAVTDLDILSEYVGVQNLCFVHVLKDGGGRSAIKAVYDIIYGEQKTNARQADAVIKKAQNLSFMNRL
jgi:ppGpp synthetase/RelA/SpoT-type nucleotidyltranferase